MRGFIIVAPGLVSSNRDSAGCTGNNNALETSKPKLPSVRNLQRTPCALIKKPSRRPPYG